MNIDKNEEIKEILHWAKVYEHESPDRVLLGSNDIPKALRSDVARQIQLAPKLSQKLPSWEGLRIYIPQGLNLEQASSSETASYKSSFVREDDILMDLTGGLAVDFSAFLQKAKETIYVEEDENLYQTVRYNLQNLYPNKVEAYHLHCSNSMEDLETLLERYRPTVLYVDPARRESQTNTAKRTYGIEDCSPNLFELIRRVKSFDPNYQVRIVAKLSPMLDVKYCLKHVSALKTVHCVAVHNEVKELLLEIDLSLDESYDNFAQTKLIASNLNRLRPSQVYTTTSLKEDTLSLVLAERLGRYVYEPNGAVMKLGLFKSLAKYYDLPVLHPNSHLYTSDKNIEGFHGRSFKVKELIDFSSSNIRKLNKLVERADVICRNFPMKADVLQKKLKIKAGGDQIILATTLWDNRQVLLICYLCKL